jgi:hypothetical protein
MAELIQAGGAIIAASISGVAVYFAAKAEKNSRPVSNGFASGVREDLKEIRSLVIRHIENHDK